MEKKESEFGTKLLSEMKQLRKDVTTAAQSVSPDDAGYDRLLKTQLKVTKRTVHLDSAFVGTMMQDLNTFSGTMDDLRAASRSTTTTQQILEYLYFPRITARQRKIPDAHATTFKWVYQNDLPKSGPKIGFVDWLQAEDGIFWIQGKPGSGKSTLMKFLASNPETMKLLSQGDPGRKMHLATFFFWHAGSALQKSQEGLLRSILFEILKQCPKLAAEASNLRSEYRGVDRGVDAALEFHENSLEPWTCDELLFVCCGIGAHAQHGKFVLFIDGLDEYEEDHKAASDLVETVRQLGCARNFKVCVSSRPWVVFSDAFGGNANLTLKLEDLTRNDIRRYISDKFTQHLQYQRLMSIDSTYSALVEEVCKRAQGVFLWVYLAVRDLLEGLTNADSPVFLINRLDAFPLELEEFFQHIIDTIPKLYLKQTARIFDIARLAPEPQSMVAYSFVEEIEADPEALQGLAATTMKNDEIRQREDRLRRHLDARCRGLLEVTADEESQPLYYRLKVDFLHRTVSEFLRRSIDLSSYLGQAQASRSSPAIMSRALIAKIRYAEQFELAQDDELSGPQKMVDNLLHFVGLINHASTEITILQAAESALAERDISDVLRPEAYIFDNVLARHILNSTDAQKGRLGLKQLDKFSRSQSHSQERGWSHNVYILTGMCCERGLAPYVVSKLRDVDFQITSNGPKRPLLDYALAFPNKIAHPEIIQALLQRGADPNQAYRGDTVWTRFLLRKHTRAQIQSDAILQQVTKLLVKLGADIHAEIEEKRGLEPEPVKTSPSTWKPGQLTRARPLHDDQIYHRILTPTWELIEWIFTNDERADIVRRFQNEEHDEGNGKRKSKLKNMLVGAKVRFSMSQFRPPSPVSPPGSLRRF